MTMLKAQKIEFVNRLRQDLKGHKTVAVMSIENIPDGLLQRVRNQLRPDSRILITRKSLLNRALKDGELAGLERYVERNVAIIISNNEPFELYKAVHSNRLRLAAKPNQTAQSDIGVEAGETSIAPGQTVTELKSAGIDVQIQKGKVVIAKRKVLVEKGKRISGAVANALKILDIKPFEISPKLRAAFSEGLIFTEAALSIDEEYARNEVMKSFGEAYALSIELGIVTGYNVGALLARAYKSAVALGLEAKVYEPEIAKMLIANAAAQAAALLPK